MSNTKYRNFPCIIRIFSFQSVLNLIAYMHIPQDIQGQQSVTGR